MTAALGHTSAESFLGPLVDHIDRFFNDYLSLPRDECVEIGMHGHVVFEVLDDGELVRLRHGTQERVALSECGQKWLRDSHSERHPDTILLPGDKITVPLSGIIQ